MKLVFYFLRKDRILPIRYYPYTTIVTDHIFFSAPEELPNEVNKVFEYVQQYVEDSIGKWDNKVAIEIKIDDIIPTLFMGYKDGNYALGFNIRAEEYVKKKAIEIIDKEPMKYAFLTEECKKAMILYCRMYRLQYEIGNGIVYWHPLDPYLMEVQHQTYLCGIMDRHGLSQTPQGYKFVISNRNNLTQVFDLCEAWLNFYNCNIL